MSNLPIPRVLKGLLSPIWDRGLRSSRLIRDYSSALLHGRFERCAVCGRFAPILRRRVDLSRLGEMWGLTPRLAEALAQKELYECARCGAKLRARRMARVLLDLYPGESGETHPSIWAWANDPAIRKLHTAEINRVDGLHYQFSRLPSHVFSDFVPGAQDGSIVDGIRSEDLTKLTYDDAMFDLVITSESLEHVPYLDRALSEILRILKPGGRHIFTIPLITGVPKTFARSVIREDGSIEHRAVQLCHPGGDTGYPVFTEFGADFPDLLRQAGFEAEVLYGPATEDDIAQVYVTRKPMQS